ncbi:MAG: class I SAM-dependent methyltransferase [Candidatus Dormibacteraceae bacterium]
MPPSGDPRVLAPAPAPAVTEHPYVPAEHADLSPSHWWIRGRRAVLPALMARHLEPGATVLDVGCGAGLLTEVVARRYSVRAVDLDPTSVAKAHDRGIDATLLVAGGPLPGPVDAACAFDVMEHTDDDVGFARSLVAAVRPGGLVVVAVPAYRWLWTEMDDQIGHRRRYTAAGLRRVMAEAGLVTLQLTYFNSLLLPLIALARAFNPSGADQVREPAAAVNGLLARVFEAEERLLRRLRLPAGVSVLYIGSKLAH